MTVYRRAKQSICHLRHAGSKSYVCQSAKKRVGQSLGFVSTRVGAYKLTVPTLSFRLYQTLFWTKMKHIVVTKTGSHGVLKVELLLIVLNFFSLLRRRKQFIVVQFIGLICFPLIRGLFH